ncbi:MAG: endonuclease I [Halomonadaceae bacterium]|nr:MAG: endonuclease I [Halomonadaceae bacterium]
MQHPDSATTLCTLLSVSLLLCLSATSLAQSAPDPEQVLKEQFWGQLYAQGGTTLYCRENFSSGAMLITHSPVYFPQEARNYLRCGTLRSCLNDNETYRALAADMHNLFPERSRYESRRRGPYYTQVDPQAKPGECGERTEFGRFEPPSHAKGVVARALFHVHSRYQLPLPGDVNVLREWHQQHPPSPSEQERNEMILQLQGFANPFISDPSLADELL